MIGLVVPDASKYVSPFREYWYLVNVGLPLMDPVNVTLREVVEPSIADTLLMVGVVPILFVVAGDGAVELADVHAVPDNALKTTV